MIELYPGAIYRPSVIHHPKRPDTWGIVEHWTAGHELGDLAILDGPTVDVHFWIGRKGKVVQFLPLDSMAWHAMHTANTHCLGIEHELYPPTDGYTWTPAQFEASAALNAWLCDRFDIPPVKVDPRTPDVKADWHGLFGHADLQGIDGNDHNDTVPPDPGWPKFLAAVKREIADIQGAPPEMTLRQRLQSAGYGPEQADRLIACRDGWIRAGKPIKKPIEKGGKEVDDSTMHARLVKAGFGPQSADVIVFARRWCLQGGTP